MTQIWFPLNKYSCCHKECLAIRKSWVEFETSELQWNNCHLEFSTLPLQLPEREPNGWHQSEQNWVILVELPFIAAFHPENGGCGYCSVIVLYSTGWWSWSSLMSYWVKDSLSVCTWQVSMAAGGDEGMEKVCRKQNWFPLCCMTEKILSDKTVFGLTLATWAWKNKNNKCAPVGQRSWQCCTRLKLK